MNEVKRSIFKQKVYARRCKIKSKEILSDLSFINSAGYEYSIELDVESECISENSLIELDIALPLLNRGDKFYIIELEQLVTIKDVYRTSQDSVVYYVEPKYIEDDKTEEIGKECLDRISRFKEYKERVRFLNSELENIKSKWYYKLFAKRTAKLKQGG